MFKVVICLSMLVACIMSAPAPGVLVGAPIVTATSSQVIARNYNAAFAIPAPVVPVLHSAPLVAAPAFAPHAFAAPVLAHHALAAPALAPRAFAAPAFAPALAAPLSSYPYYL